MKIASSELEKSRNLLVDLGLEHASEILLELLERAVHEKRSLVKFLECHVVQIDGRSYRLKHIELGFNEGEGKAERGV